VPRPATRTWAAISGGWHRPARAGPCVNDPGTPGRLTLRQIPSRIRKAARHRPVSTLTLTAGRRWPAQGGKDFSGGWLGRSARQDVPRGPPVEADPAASGTRRCTASSIVPPHVTASPRRPSSRLDRYVDDPSGDGSATMSVTRGLGGGKKLWYFAIQWNRWGVSRVRVDGDGVFAEPSPPCGGR
jgi:hypothetical protein